MPEEARKPNIIFIMADDLGYGDLGCYGQEVVQTPNIDQLAAEGMRFTDAYAGSTVCAPSRCCLMTGMHTGHAWIRGNARFPLRARDVTVAEVLKTAGYRTGLMGKWGLGEPDSSGIPNRQGFDEFYGYLNQGNAHNYYPEYLWDNMTQSPLRNVVSKDEPRYAIEKVDYSHDLVAEKALDFVKRNHADPFFLYLALTIPHANNEGGRVSGDGMEVPDYGDYADKDWPNQQKGFAAMVSRMDKDVGRLMALLKELNIDEDTLVIFTSDNGPHKEGGNDPTWFKSSGILRGIKRDLYEGGIRVPMIARWPEKVAPGSECSIPCALWDFLPTAADIAGVYTPSGLDGTSWMPLLTQDPSFQYEPRNLYWEFHEQGFKQAVRKGRWKGVWFRKDDKFEIYDLYRDPMESTDLAEHHPGLVQEFRDYITAAHTPSELFPVKLLGEKGEEA